MKEKKITCSELEQLIPKQIERNIFDLVNFILNENVYQALAFYDDLLLKGEDTVKINSILIKQFRLLLQISILIKIGYEKENIIKSLKIHPYRFKMILKQLDITSKKKLIIFYEELIENDYLIKIGKVDKKLLFQLSILKIIK